jgi:hypothetical protein
VFAIGRDLLGERGKAMQSEKPEQADRSNRRAAFGLLALLLLAPLLAACKEVKPGSGLDTIRQQREQNPHRGR